MISFLITVKILLKATGMLKGLIATWYNEGEKATKYFLGLEKRNFANKTISRLERANGTLLTVVLY